MTRVLQVTWLLALTAISVHAAATPDREWRFAVSLDDKPIGYHRFALDDRGDERRLLSEARFNVKLLSISAYSYEHSAQEVWRGDCLHALDASTDDNGKSIAVRGARDADRFVIDKAGRTHSLSPCVQTFAYWNPQILSATHLLNPQTGEYVPVSVTHIGAETIHARGRHLQADRYRIVGRPTTGAPLQIDLWYSSNRQWLALESIADGGRRLRYTLQ